MVHFTTEDLPASDSTHSYVVKMTTGIADPLQGLYYVESWAANTNNHQGTNY